MENKGLLFIPDISGFTKFINQTEIEHSRLIIQELLEILINANDIGLSISEIEGDAILFYKFGDLPALESLSQQVEKMFCEFHQTLGSYEMLRYCQCRACTSAVQLTLKVVTHYGEFTQYNVKNFNKLIGKDLIVAHQLLKNDIEKHEYWLVTSNIAGSAPQSLKSWMEWSKGVRQTEEGFIPYHYTPLSPLKKQISPAQGPGMSLVNKINVLSFTREYETEIIPLFHAVGSFQYRHRWLDGVIKTEEASHFLPRVGMKCRCILDDGSFYIYSSSYHYTEERIEFSETNEDDKSVTYYTLQKVSPNRTRLTLQYYVDGYWRKLNFALFQSKKMKAMYLRSMDNLNGLVKEIKIPPPPVLQ